MNRSFLLWLLSAGLLAGCGKDETAAPPSASAPTSAPVPAPVTPPAPTRPPEAAAVAPAKPATPTPAVPTAAPTATLKIGGVDVPPERLAADFPEAQRAIAEANRMLQEIRAARQTSAPPAKASAASAVVQRLSPGDLSGDVVTRGLKEALGKGLERALAQLGGDGGFLTNIAVRIPMPEQLTIADALLRKVGQGKLADDFVASMNHAAEQAVPAAAETFAGALRQMTVEDAQKLLQGPDDAATQFFRRTTDARCARSSGPSSSKRPPRPVSPPPTNWSPTKRRSPARSPSRKRWMSTAT